MFSTIAIDIGGMGPANNPCQARKKITSSRLVANPSMNDIAVKPNMQSRSALG